MRNPLLILLVVLALLGGLAVLFFTIGSDRSSPDGAVPVGLGPGDPVEPGGLSPGVLPGAEPSSEGARDVAGEGAPTAEGVEAAGAPITLRGRAILIDELGRERREEDGEFLLWPESIDSPEGLRVEVRQGEWESSFERCESLAFSNLILGGRGAGLSTDMIPLPADLYLELRGMALRGVLLHALSAADDAELSGVEIGADDLHLMARFPQPEKREIPVVVSSATSPILLPPPTSSASGGKHGYWVRATDHAWARIDIDHTAPGDRELRLLLGGHLEVELIGELPRPEIALWLFTSDEELLWHSSQIESVNRLESIPVGEYRVALELGDDPTGRLVFGEAQVEILPGRTAYLQITPTQLEPPTRDVTVAGVVHVPPGWPEVEENLALRFTPLDVTLAWGAEEVLLVRDRLQSGTRGAYAFAAELPLAGSWQVTIEPVGYRERIEVGPEGVRGLAFELPPLARVTVQAVSAEDRSPVPVTGLNWTPAGEGRSLRVAARPSPPDPPGTMVFVALGGEIDLRVWPDPPYRFQQQLVTLRPGENRIRVELERECGFDITFRDGESTVPFDMGTRFSARDAAGEVVELGWGAEGRVLFPAPGTYRLSITDFPGFAPIEGFEVTVPGWEVTPVDLHLTRLK